MSINTRRRNGAVQTEQAQTNPDRKQPELPPADDSELGGRPPRMLLLIWGFPVLLIVAAIIVRAMR